MLVLEISLGLLIGLSLGLFGGGGSILTVPVLVYAVGFDPKASIAMSLLVVGVTSLIGAIGHWRIGNVHARVALVFGSVAMLGTYLGARLSVLVSGVFQLMLFAVVMLAAAYFMLLGRVPGVRPEAGEPHLDDRSRLPIALIITEGLAVGVLTGLVGVGGGFLIGTRIVSHVPQQALRRGFAVLLFVVAAAILYQNRFVLMPT